MKNKNLTLFTYFEDCNNRILMDKTNLKSNIKRSFMSGKSKWISGIPSYEGIKQYLEIDGGRIDIPLESKQWKTGHFTQGMGVDQFPIIVDGEKAHLRINFTCGNNMSGIFTSEIRILSKFDAEDEVIIKKKYKRLNQLHIS